MADSMGQRHKPEVPVSGRSRRPVVDPLLLFVLRRQVSVVQRLLLLVAARCRIATYRLPLHNSHPSIDAGDCPTTCFRGTADSDHQVLADGCWMSAVTSCEQELATLSSHALAPSSSTMVCAIRPEPSRKGSAFPTERKPCDVYNLKAGESATVTPN